MPNRLPARSRATLAASVSSFSDSDASCRPVIHPSVASVSISTAPRLSGAVPVRAKNAQHRRRRSAGPIRRSAEAGPACGTGPAPASARRARRAGRGIRRRVAQQARHHRTYRGRREPVEIVEDQKDRFAARGDLVEQHGDDRLAGRHRIVAQQLFCLLTDAARAMVQRSNEVGAELIGMVVVMVQASHATS